MAAKQIQYDTKGRQALLAGVAALSKAVKTTLGPKGRNVIIDAAMSSSTRSSVPPPSRRTV